MNTNTTSGTSGVQRHLGLIIGSVVILAMASFAAWWVLTPSWRPLLGATVSESSHNEAINYLMKWEVPYKQDSESGSLLVHKEQVIALRNRLEKLGIPSKQPEGLEIFTETDYGMSEFTQRINHQRGLEGEIARTIRSFTDIKMARVHLTMPKESIFKDRRVAAKASVVVEAKPGQNISAEQVSGIQSLVSAAVENLKSDQVTILDEKGRVLSSSEDQPNNQRKYALEDIESEYARKATHLVREMVPNTSVEVAVNAQINFDKVRSIKEQVIPQEEEGSGYISKQKSQVNSKPAAKNEEQEVLTSNRLLETEYVFSKERSEIEYASGKIEKLSIGIVISRLISDVAISDIENVVASGLGLDLDRGDKIVVVAVPTPETPEEKVTEDLLQLKPQVHPALGEENNRTFFPLDNRQQLLIYGAGVLALFVLLIIVYLFGRGRKAGASPMTASEREQLLSEVRYWIAQEKSTSLKPGGRI